MAVLVSNRKCKNGHTYCTLGTLLSMDITVMVLQAAQSFLSRLATFSFSSVDWLFINLLVWQAARKHYCTNKHVLKKRNVDEDW